ncbi:hypothetical protein [Actinomadura macrotermitis]|uniref:Uncharacterized protein n=1 Tax=Actinomadura macrotermitis TaxID=2585200 RepID=A0A7K0C3Z3_9ACTN|nr:hypothetical protein [Actinomadura macrotermitis]MQY08096.1 hypothetical protein [Actinomadura macrotermitis]
MLYPEPPHLELAFFHEGVPEERLLADVCRRLAAAGAVATGRLQVAPQGLRFGRPTDIGAEGDEIHVPAEQVWSRLDGEVPGHRVMRAGFELRPLGLVVATYNRGAAGRHPVALLTNADAIEFPESEWSSRQRKKAKRFSAAVVPLMKDICEAVGPLYASLGVEATLLGPERLAASDSGPGDVFVADRLLAYDPRLADKLAQCFSGGHVDAWATGTYHSSWAPFNDSWTTAEDPALPARSGRLLGAAAASFMRDQGAGGQPA